MNNQPQNEETAPKRASKRAPPRPSTAVKDKRKWEQSEDEILLEARKSLTPHLQIAKVLNRTTLACRLRFYKLERARKKSKSPKVKSPRTSNPFVASGDSAPPRDSAPVGDSTSPGEFTPSADSTPSKKQSPGDGPKGGDDEGEKGVAEVAEAEEDLDEEIGPDVLVASMEHLREAVAIDACDQGYPQSPIKSPVAECPNETRWPLVPHHLAIPATGWTAINTPAPAAPSTGPVSTPQAVTAPQEDQGPQPHLQPATGDQDGQTVNEAPAPVPALTAVVVRRELLTVSFLLNEEE